MHMHSVILTATSGSYFEQFSKHSKIFFFLQVNIYIKGAWEAVLSKKSHWKMKKIDD